MDSNLTIEVNHTGSFVDKPIVYFNPVKVVVSNVDFRSMSFMEFISYVKKLVKNGRINVYYCLPQRSLGDGLRALEDENDYLRFLDVGYENGGMINLYIDHNPKLSDNEFVEHEPDDEVIQIQPFDDPFV
ncbi:unnamed protein product [Lactuca saligna]|uniref:PB1-like domain-containing protein n=1 Tax=Lactuca saligna TaxID=75948 RepID=A0AA35YZ96_LACSI|nr:unnamed protein product [Lactuca saligna]